MDKLIANDAKDTICMKMYNVSFYHERYYTKFRQIFGYSQVPLKNQRQESNFHYFVSKRRCRLLMTSCLYPDGAVRRSELCLEMTSPARRPQDVLLYSVRPKSTKIIKPESSKPHHKIQIKIDLFWSYVTVFNCAIIVLNN